MGLTIITWRPFSNHQRIDFAEVSYNGAGNEPRREFWVYVCDLVGDNDYNARFNDRNSAYKAFINPGMLKLLEMHEASEAERILVGRLKLALPQKPHQRRKALHFDIPPLAAQGAL